VYQFYVLAHCTGWLEPSKTWITVRPVEEGTRPVRFATPSSKRSQRRKENIGMKRLDVLIISHSERREYRFTALPSDSTLQDLRTLLSCSGSTGAPCSIPPSAMVFRKDGIVCPEYISLYRDPELPPGRTPPSPLGLRGAMLEGPIDQSGMSGSREPMRRLALVDLLYARQRLAFETGKSMRFDSARPLLHRETESHVLAAPQSNEFEILLHLYRATPGFGPQEEKRILLPDSTPPMKDVKIESTLVNIRTWEESDATTAQSSTTDESDREADAKPPPPRRDPTPPHSTEVSPDSQRSVSPEQAVGKVESNAPKPTPMDDYVDVETAEVSEALVAPPEPRPRSPQRQKTPSPVQHTPSSNNTAVEPRTTYVPQSSAATRIPLIQQQQPSSYTVDLSPPRRIPPPAPAQYVDVTPGKSTVEVEATRPESRWQPPNDQPFTYTKRTSPTKDSDVAFRNAVEQALLRSTRYAERYAEKAQPALESPYQSRNAEIFYVEELPAASSRAPGTERLSQVASRTILRNDYSEYSNQGRSNGTSGVGSENPKDEEEDLGLPVPIQHGYRVFHSEPISHLLPPAAQTRHKSHLGVLSPEPTPSPTETKNVTLRGWGTSHAALDHRLEPDIVLRSVLRQPIQSAPSSGRPTTIGMSTGDNGRQRRSELSPSPSPPTGAPKVISPIPSPRRHYWQA
jgi:hypothetical protein